MSKVTLLYPRREHYVFGPTPHVHVEADAGSYPPLGMLYLAAHLLRETAHEVTVLDAHTEGIEMRGLRSYLARQRPDVVGIYFSTYYLYDSILAARAVREVCPRAVVVAGGPHVDFYARETVMLPEVDVVMLGDSERSFTALVEAIAGGAADPAAGVDNVVSKAAPDRAPARSMIQDLDALPFPARHLLPHRHYRSILARRNPITTLNTSRGCPFKCYFCSNIESGHRVRYRGAEGVVEEMTQVVRDFGIRDFLIFDELFTSSRQRVFEICELLSRRGPRVRWHCRSRADVLDREMLRAMKRAGCRLIQFGIETGVPRLQKLINKKLDIERVRRTVELVHREGIYTYANFMFGLPTETAAETRQTLEYAKSLRLDFAAFGMFHPIPGSVFYDRGIEEGRFDDFWRRFVEAPTSTIEDHSWTRRDRRRFDDQIASSYVEFYVRVGHVLRWLSRVDSMEQVRWMSGAALHVLPRMVLKRY